MCLIVSFFCFRLRASGVKIRFVTNTTKESKNVLHTRLANCGFELKKEEIFSSLTAAHQYVKERDLKYEMKQILHNGFL